MNKSNEKFDMKKEILDWIKTIVFAIGLAIIIKMFIFNTTVVSGSSMYPTLENNDRLFAEKVSLYFKEPERGQMVIFKSPLEEKDYIKRVIGVEGDKVSIIDGKVYVNSEEVDEYYIEDNSYTYVREDNNWIVGEGEVFVLGDNRELDGSIDSRYFGTIPIDSIKGISNFRFYPLDSNFGRLE